MSVNLNAAAFIDQTQTDFSKKVIAENYMQLYPYAAEDFPTHPDLRQYIADVTAWMMAVDKQLIKLSKELATHTHKIPPHTHSVISHSKTSPIGLTTLVPVNASRIVWIPCAYPIYINTSLATPNYAGNFISLSTASEGNILPIKRRTLPIPLTLVPKLSPTLQDSLKPGV